MSEDSQFVVPPSFIALFVPPGRIRPTATRDVIAARYDLCEDLAQMLTETARAKQFELGVDEGTVLERILRGLLAQADDAAGGTAAGEAADAAEGAAAGAPAGSGSDDPCTADTGAPTPAEARWIVRRLAELLDWPALQDPPAPLPD